MLVAGVDSSTQSCKVVVVDADTGAVLRHGAAAHPEGTECPVDAWWDAFTAAADQAGGLADVAAISVGGQQHGMVLLDAAGVPLLPAQLWNDTKAAGAARDLVAERGAATWAADTGLVPVASFTISKLRWLADHHPALVDRIAAVCLPHDWLSWRLRGTGRLDDLATDRSEASGTGYVDATTGQYRRDLLALALRSEEAASRIVLPRILGTHEAAGRSARSATIGDALVGPGCGDNAGAALALGLAPGDVLVSIGTSGTVSAVSRVPLRDPSGLIAGFADAAGHHLPLTCTMNGTRTLTATAQVLGVDSDTFDRLALAAEPGAGGLVEIPHLAGERTPNRPHATGSLTGLTLANFTRENLARAAVEGVLCALAYGLDALRAHGCTPGRVVLVGGGAQSASVQALAPAILGVPVEVPRPAQFVALGAARQAAWTARGGDAPPPWPAPPTVRHAAADQPWLRERFVRALAAST